jgi:CspA family cold shock protein
MVMAKGTVKFFDFAKGFGFIIPQTGGQDIFFHKSAVQLAGIAQLAKGQQLTFDMETDSKGLIQAAKLKLDPDSRSEGAGIAGLSRQRGERQRGYVNQNPRSAPPDRVNAVAQPSDRDRVTRDPKELEKARGWQRSYDRYCELAGNCSDLVERERSWQHAEHYLRMLNGSNAYDERDD